MGSPGSAGPPLLAIGRPAADSKPSHPPDVLQHWVDLGGTRIPIPTGRETFYTLVNLCRIEHLVKCPAR